MYTARWKMHFTLLSLLATTCATPAVAQVVASGVSGRTANVADANLPKIENAKLDTRVLAEPFGKSFQQLIDQATTPGWIAYSVPEVQGQRTICCGNYNGDEYICRTCRLEDENSNGRTFSSEKNHTIKLEGARELVVLYRLEAKRVTRIRLASEECSLDFGGLSLLWLTSVKPAESVEFLTGFVKGQDVDRHDVAQGAVSAIAMHADASAGQALEAFVAPQQTESLRKQAAFWLGEARGRFGFDVLTKLAKTDPSVEVRSHVTFALSISHEPAAIDEMIRMAHRDPSNEVRGKALFWLAQKAGKKAIEALDGAIANDPDTEVKKKAVFAISQLPKDDGVPKLIQLAQNNRNPEVRKQAMFWLGESNDPRALEFFEKVLSQ